MADPARSRQPGTGRRAGGRRELSRAGGRYAPHIDDPRDDLELVAAARAGDHRALDQLLRRHVDRVHAVCLRITGDPADAADATQEALIAAARGLARFDGRSRFSTWIYRVATNASLDELRRRRRHARPWAPAGDDGARPEPADPAPAVDATVAGHLDVTAALAGIPADFRAAVVLRDLCDLDYSEIAAVLGVPIGTVRSRIARGRAAVARQIGPGPAGNPPAPSDRPSNRP
ncbi:MAG: RNA polymerase sigma factor [Acidimicrobiales bacterium]